MRQDNYNTNDEDKKGKHLTWEERQIIEHLYNIQEKSYSEIADELGKHRTTISREIKKGEVELLNSDYSTRKEYVAKRAQEVYDNNATAKGPKIKIAKDHELAKFIEKKIKKDDYAPEVIANEIKEEEEFNVNIHWKTIYNYIDKGILMVDRDDLTYGEYKSSKTKKKRKEKESTKKRKEGRRISDRPKKANNRAELGHWEMDLLEGSKSKEDPFLLVLTERLSRKGIIEKIPDKTQESVIEALDRIEQKIGPEEFREKFKSITTDNGTEFQNYEKIERSFTENNTTRTEQYYADAYCSWQRGSNENFNKMIRRFIPKGSTLKKYSKKEVKRIQRWINEYPRKMFNFKNAKKVYKQAA